MRHWMYIVALVFISACGKQSKELDAHQVVQRLPYFTSSDFTPRWFNNAKELDGKHKIPPFSLLNQNGETVNNATYSGKIYVADFFFTVCPGICPKLTKNMTTIQEQYKNDPEVLLLSHTVMPWHDSVSVLKEYATKHKIDDQKWNLVTGDTDQIYEHARLGYFADEDFIKTQEASDFIHTENFVLVDGRGFIRGVYNGTIPLEIKRLSRHLEMLKKEEKI